MKKNMLNGICAAAICIALNTFTAQAAPVNSNEPTIGTNYFQDSTSMRRGNNNKMNKGKMDKMSSDSTGKMGNMKGKSSGGYKNKGTGKSKMDTTSNK